MAPRRRPLGVTIIAILVALQGVFLLAVGGLAFVVVLGALLTGHAPLFSHVLVVGIIGGVFLIVDVLLLLVAWGLWTLKRWAFWFTVVTQILSLLGSIVTLNQTGNGTTTTTTSNIVIAIIILIYLFADRNVRAAFRT